MADISGHEKNIYTYDNKKDKDADKVSQDKMLWG